MKIWLKSPVKVIKKVSKVKKDHAEWGRMYSELAQSSTSEVCASSRYGVIDEKVIRRIENDVSAKLRLNEKDDLLDLGCGTGLISINLSKKVNSITGMDFGRQVLRRARRNFAAAGRQIELAQGDVTNLPFKNERFDKVLCYSVVMCFEDYDDFKDALTEMLRVCKSGGMVLVGDIPEKKKKEEWLRGERRRGESLPSYFIRRIKQGIIKYRYSLSARDFSKMKDELNITPVKAAGMFYDADVIMRICRDIGVKGTIMDQPPSLAFGNTRVDLLLEKE